MPRHVLAHGVDAAHLARLLAAQRERLALLYDPPRRRRIEFQRGQLVMHCQAHMMIVGANLPILTVAHTYGQNSATKRLTEMIFTLGKVFAPSKSRSPMSR